MDSQLSISLAAILATSAFAWAREEKASSPKSFQASDAKYMQGDAKLKWIAEMRNQLPIAKRKTGPFGFSQDLTVKKIKSTQQQTPQVNVFPKAVTELRINIVFGKSFFIGSREIKEGEVFPLVYKGDTGNINLSVKVISVKSNQITFKNLATGETIVKKIGKLPKGWQKTNGFKNIKGVTPNGQGKGPVEVQGKPKNEN